MKIQAYPTNGVTPVDAAEARRIANWYLYSQRAQERGDEIKIREFDHCFTVVTSPAPQTLTEGAAAMRSLEVGDGVSVIDKHSSHVSFWPSWPEDTVAERYAAAQLAGEIEHQPSWPKADVD